MTRNLSSLLSQHEDLEELFLLHQEAVLLVRPDLARQLLDIYRDLLVAHMGFEDEILLPLYARVGPDARSPLELYSGQHRKVSLLLDKAYGLLTLPQDDPSLRRRQMIALFDHESTLKHLVEHHDFAEKKALFPVLEAKLEAAEAHELAEKGWRVWEDEKSRLRATYREVTAALDERTSTSRS